MPGTRVIRATLLAVVLVFCAGRSRAQSTPPARETNTPPNAPGVDSTAPQRPYSLTNPVPRALLREFSADRPGRTENAFTVDVGHLQFEMGVVTMTDDHREGVRLQSFGIGALSSRIGLRHNIDLQIITQLITLERVRTSGVPARTSASPVSDFTARLKVNVWGNDGGRTAFAVMPFVTVPTNTHGVELRAAEGGVSLPLGIALGDGWGMGLMSQLEFVHSGQAHRYQVSALHSATISHDIIGPIGGYVELAGEIAAERGARLLATGDAGIAIGVAPDLQIDFGANVGLTRATERVVAFVGLSKRY